MNTKVNTETLTEDEVSVMRCLVMLGETKVERKELISWVSEKYIVAIDSLAKKPWIKVDGEGNNRKLSICRGYNWEIDLPESDINNSAWLRALCDRIVDSLPSKPVNYRILPTGKDSLSTRALTVYRREKHAATLHLALNMLVDLDLSNKENVEYLIEFLSKIIRDNVHCAIYSNLDDVSILERVMDSPVFEELAAAHKFEIYNLMAIFRLAKLGDTIYNLTDEQHSCIQNFSMFWTIFGKDRLEHHYDILGDEEKPIIEELFEQSGLLVEKIIDSCSKTRELIYCLSEEEMIAYFPRIFTQLIEYVRSLACSYLDDRRFLIIFCDDLIEYIKSLKGNSFIPKEVQGRLYMLLSDFQSDLQCNKKSMRLSGEPILNEDGEFEDEEDEYFNHFGERFSYYWGRVKKCVTLKQVDDITESIIEDIRLTKLGKVKLLLRVKSHLGYDPLCEISELMQNGLDKRTKRDEEKGEDEKEDYLKYCSDEDKLSRVKSIMAQILTRIETIEPRVYESLDYYAQELLFACRSNYDDAITNHIEKYHTHGVPKDLEQKDYWLWAMESLYRTLNKENFSGTATRFIRAGLLFLEAEVEKSYSYNEMDYDKLDTAVTFAKLLGDSDTIEYYMSKRDESMDLGFVFRNKRVT